MSRSCRITHFLARVLNPCAQQPQNPPVRRHLLATLAMLLVVRATHGADVTETIDAILRDPYFKNVQAGVQIVRLGDQSGTGETLYERNATTPLIPASNLKLITTAAALEGLGPNFAFRTVLAKRGNTLALIGDGDPALGDSELLRGLGQTSMTMFDAWAKALVARGVTKIDKLVFDDSMFDNTFVHPDWPVDQLHKRYVAGVAGLNFNANCIDFYLKPGAAGTTVNYVREPAIAYGQISNRCVSGRQNAVWLSREVGGESIVLRGQIERANVDPISVTVHNPPAFATTALRDALRNAGATIEGEPMRDGTVRTQSTDWSILAVHETRLDQILWRANKDSMNLYAEAFAKRLGARTSQQPGSWANATAAMGTYMRTIGVPAEQFRFVDGCGLARGNRLSPAAIIRVLEHEAVGPNRDVYVGSLAVAGVDGTLKTRFTRGGGDQVVGKSGFIDGVSALSGYVTDRNGRLVAFSILFNGIAKGTNSRAKEFQERIVRAVR